MATSSGIFADPARLAALAASGLLDATPDPAIDRVVRLVRDLLCVPTAFVAVAGPAAFTFKSIASAPGALLAPGDTVPISLTFCREVVASGAPLVVTDARHDPEFAAGPMASSRFIAYAGVPIAGPGGHVLGTLSAADISPRDWSADDLRVLADLAPQVAAVVALHIAGETIAASARDHDALVQSMSEVVFKTDGDGQWAYLSPAWTQATGFECEESIGHDLLESAHPDDRTWLQESLFPLLMRDRETVRAAVRFAHRDGGYRTFEAAVRPIFGPGGSFAGVTGTLTDVTEREALADAVAANEEEFRSLCNSTSALICTLDEQGSVSFANRALRDLLGQAETADIATAWRSALHPEDLERWKRAIYEALANGLPASLELRIHDAEGTVRWLTCRVTQRRTSSGTDAGWVLTANDGTWERAAREALRAREEHFRALCNSTPAMMWTEDERGECTFLNDAWVLFTGRPRHEQLGLAWLEQVHPDDRHIPRTALAAARAARAPYAAEFRLRHNSGGYRWVLDQALPRFGPDGDYLGMIGTSFDISERKAAEEALQEANRQVNAIFEHAPVGIHCYTPDGTLVRLNEAAAAMAGVVPSRWVDRYNIFAHPMLPGAVPEEARAAFVGEVVEVRNKPREVPARGAATNQRGQQVFDWLFYPLLKPGGDVEGVVGFTRDVTERVQMEEAVLEAQKLESIGMLAGGVAHDFNNILMAVLGNVSLALRDAPDGSPLAAYLADIELAAVRARDLAQQLLAYSGRGRLYVEPVDLNAILQEIGPLLRVTIGREAQLALELAPHVPAVEADATQLRQVVVNLITNASEAIGDAPGTIVLRSGYTERGPLDGPATFIEVADSGEGMDEETRARIFDPFFTTKFTGRGLGLAAVLGIVRGHGGQVVVHSTPGEGATFRIYFPALTGEVRAPAFPARTSEWHATGTVLVVDDEEAVRTLIERALGRYGFEVLTACDGVEGVELFEANADRIACVLLDLTMPRADGREALRGIRGHRPDATVVMMSGYSETEIAPQLDGERPDAFLQKPFGLAALRDMLEQSIAGEAQAA